MRWPWVSRSRFEQERRDKEHYLRNFNYYLDRCNLLEAWAFRMHSETRAANKGIKRLKRKIKCVSDGR